MIRRLIVAGAIGILTVFVATPVEAAEWCLHDPALVFKVPDSKQRITIYATEGVQGTRYEGRLKHAKLDFDAKADKRHGAVHIRIRANIPGQGRESFATVLVVSSEPYGAGTIYGVVMGRSGHRMELSFEFHYDRGS
ncbi:MAG TPA: hypothetical protein VGQ29_11125 [Gemmatimonadales bacterium]|nr:hypothetical protein [Gemmatimonadales bacterium]